MPVRATPVPPTPFDETEGTRAYRLGKSETFSDLYALLVDEHYSTRDLQQELVHRMHDLTRRDPAALLGRQRLPQFEESRGLADACIACFDLIAVQKLHPYALSDALAACLLATWPPDYLDYRRRYEEAADQDPTLPATVSCLELRQWYAAVAALNGEIACTELSGLPPSEEQLALAAQLLYPVRACAPGAPVLCAA